MRVDVVIVGAGISGLACARRLRGAGLEVRVVEARDRVGGRTLSEPMGSAILDRGGQWIGPGQERVMLLASELGLATFPTYAMGRHVLCAGGRRTTYTGTIPRISPFGLAGLGIAIAKTEILGRRIPRAQPWLAKHARAWDQRTADDTARGLGDRAARAAFDAAVRAVFGADAGEISLLYFGWYTRAGEGFFNLVEVHGGAQERRFVRGAQALSLELAERVGASRVIFEAPVHAIVQSESGVTVVTERGSYEAAHAVVALAPPLCASIAFEPELPASRTSLVTGSTMGATIKIVALYERSFWRPDGLSGEAVFEDGPLSVTFDNSSHDGKQAALVGFIVGSNARLWRERPAAERRRAVLESLAHAFGAMALSPTEYIEHDWDAEPHSRGCPVAIFPPGVLAEHGPALREPCGRVHWAGTETATHYPGYMEGALEAAERAAREVMARRICLPIHMASHVK